MGNNIMLVHSTERDYPIREHEREMQVIKTKQSYFLKDGKVTKLTSSKQTGLNRHSGKRWYRWIGTGGACVYRTKSDKIAGFQKSMRAFNGMIPFFEYQRDADFANLVNDYVGPLNFRDVYPCAQYWPFNGQESLPTGIRGAFKEKDLKDFSIHLFGSTRYRKPLNRALGAARPEAISVAHDFRGLVPIDWIIDFLRLNPFDEETQRLWGVQIGSVRRALMTIDPKSYRHLLKVTMNHGDAYALNDVSIQVNGRWNRAVNGRAKTFQELHDLALPPRQPLRFEYLDGPLVPRQPAREDIPLTDLGKKIAGLQVPGLKIVMPETKADLVKWGAEMHNCIGGYGYNVARDDANIVLGAVYKGEKLLANFEVRDDALRQLLGKYNRAIPNEDRKKMEKAFESVGVNTNQYWGLDGNF